MHANIALLQSILCSQVHATYTLIACQNEFLEHTCRLREDSEFMQRPQCM